MTAYVKGYVKVRRISLSAYFTHYLCSAKRHHRHISASGSQTGVDTPFSGASSEEVEAKRYFDLFQVALEEVHLGLAYNPHTKMVKVLTKITSAHPNQPTFSFNSNAIKNHYLQFRLSGNNAQTYVALALSNSIGDHLGWKTPDPIGEFTLVRKM